MLIQKMIIMKIKQLNKLNEIWHSINREDKSGFGLFSLILIIFYSLLVIFGAFHHEPWRDEAQAWLIARDLDFFGILNQMKYEGTPALWHLIIAPFAKLGFPYYSIAIIHLIISVSAISVFVIKSQFSKLFKILLIFSYYFAYEYAVIARNYSITILFLFLIASMYKRRFEKPILFSFLIFFLLNTNVFGAIMGFALSLLFIFEILKQFNKKVQLLSIGVLLLGIIAVAYQLYSPNHILNNNFFSSFNYYASLYIFTNTFIPLRFEYHHLYTFIFFTFFAFIVFVTFLKKPKLVFLIVLSISGFLYIFLFRYACSHRHHALILVFIIFLLWIEKNYKENNMILKFLNIRDSIISKIGFLRKIVLGFLMFCLLYSVIYNIKTYYNEYKYNFSGAKDMGEFINKNNYDNYEILTSSIHRGVAILPYINQKSIYYFQTKIYSSYGKWIELTPDIISISNDSIVNQIESIFFENKNILVLVSDSIGSNDLPGFECIHKTTSTDFWVNGKFIYENYWLYKSTKQN